MQADLTRPTPTNRPKLRLNAPSKQHVETPVLPTYDAQDLTEGGDLAQIALQDAIYTLRITRAGKLILTK